MAMTTTDPLESDRSRQLKALQSSMPIANQQTASALESARASQVQQAVASLPPDVSSIAPVQSQLQAQQAALTATNQLQQAQQQRSQNVQLGQLGLQENSRQLRGEAAERELSADRVHQDMAAQLGRLDTSLKNKLVDDQYQFTKDQANRTLFNDRQLADFATLKAQDSVELAKYQQIADQAWQRKLQEMQQAYDVLAQTLKQGFTKESGQLNNEQRERLTVAASNLKKQISTDSANAKNKAVMFQTAGSVVGAIAGGVIGGIYSGGTMTAQGAAIGAVAGSAVGGGVGTLLGSSKVFG